MEFNWERSVVLEKVCRSEDKKSVTIKTFSRRTIHVPAEKVRIVRTRHLNDMSLVVVDLGPLEEQTDEVIIAAGRKDRFPVF